MYASYFGLFFLLFCDLYLKKRGAPRKGTRPPAKPAKTQGAAEQVSPLYSPPPVFSPLYWASARSR